MADVNDVSGITGLNVQQTNPLTLISNYAQLMNEATRNKLLNAQIGQVGANTSLAKQSLLEKQSAYIGGRLSTLAYLPLDQQTQENYNKELDRELSLGADSAGIAAFRSMVNDTKSPEELQNLAFRTAQSLVPSNVAQSMATPSFVNTGGQITGIAPPGTPNANRPLPGAGVTVGMTPAEQATPNISFTNPKTGQPSNITAPQAAGAGLIPPLPVGGQPLARPGQAAPGRYVPPTPGKGSTLGTGSYPTAAPVAGNAPIIGVPSGLTPQQVANNKVNVDFFNNEKLASTNYPQMSTPLTHAYAILDKAEHNGQVVTGPGVEELNNLRVVLGNILPNSTKDMANLDLNKAADINELGKYFKQAVMSNQFAGGSVQALSTALSGSPNMDLTNLANKNVVRVGLGLLRMRKAFTDEYAGKVDSGQANDIDSLSAYGKFASGVDPRAFVVDMMSGKERDKLYGSLKSKTDVDKFKASYDLAKNSGLLNYNGNQ